MLEETPPIPIPVAVADAQAAASMQAPNAPLASTTPLPSQTVTIPLEQLQAFTSVQARLAQMEADQRARDEASRAELVKAMAAKGQIEEALRTVRDQAQKDLEAERKRLAQTEERAKRYASKASLLRRLLPNHWSLAARSSLPSSGAISSSLSHKARRSVSGPQTISRSVLGLPTSLAGPSSLTS